ncbi:hypothetical protein [Rhodopseudomonas palustris]|uniref:hypothetical protein n=1 Tax=Rhodopseudomonas palustris TaxID=1076 RepID=UPI000E5A1E15|nr:hypothetical protein [Rhodopseudomonas palustris]QLH69597.1 hypothetical protein HZF03_01935 [Rhodopseudomonas palustris]RIA03148.1 hypothetical protein D1920_03935 [Rhodopseudomonas palustris]
MGLKEDYEAKKAADEDRYNRKQRADKEAKWARESFLRHPDRMIKYTGYLQLYTLVLSVSTILLFAATIYNAVVLHSTDEKIGESYTAVQRPFVTAKDVIVDENVMPGYWMFGVRFENNGNTPTYKMNYSSISSLSLPTDPEDAPRDPSQIVSKGTALIGPKGQYLPEGTQSGILVKTAEELAASRGKYFIRGVARYRDLFKGSEEHITKYCFAVTPYLEGNILKAGIQRCLYWNCADDECKEDKERYEAALKKVNTPK